MKALKVIYTIWLREFIAFRRDKFPIIAMVGQPLVYLLLLGNGISAGVTLNKAAGIDYLKYIYPGILGMSILFTSVFSSMSVIHDRQFGFLKEVLAAPVPRWAVALGKIFGGATTTMIQSIILICFAPFAGISLSPLVIGELLVFAFLMSLAVTSFGVLIASSTRSMQSFQMAANFVVMPMYLLSGAMFPMATAPAWMKSLMAINPLTYGVDALRHIVFSGTLVAGLTVRKPLVEVARDVGLINGTLSFDLAVSAILAVTLAAAGAYAFCAAANE